MFIGTIKNIQIILFCLSFVNVFAQDVHFSQFYASQMYLNPALTGHYYGDWQAGIHHRKQWKSIADPFISNSIFYDRHFHYYNQQINAGAIWISDQSGSSRLTTNQISLSLAYPLRSGKSTFTFGVQPGIVLKNFNRNLTYPSQFNDNTGYFDPNLPNQQGGIEESSNYGKTSLSYFDLNAGIFWTMRLPRIRPAFGIAMFHITQPGETFHGTGNIKSLRTVMHGNVLFDLKSGLYIKPGVQYHAISGTNMFNLGTEFGKKFGNKQANVKELFAGVYMRNGISRNEDALYPVIGMKYNNFRIGISYDYNTSGLKVATGTKGAYEISIVYTAPSSIPKHVSIPCERY